MEKNSFLRGVEDAIEATVRTFALKLAGLKQPSIKTFSDVKATATTSPKAPASAPKTAPLQWKPTTPTKTPASEVKI